jgi:hypothetical protein
MDNGPGARANGNPEKQPPFVDLELYGEGVSFAQARQPGETRPAPCSPAQTSGAASHSGDDGHQRTDTNACNHSSLS